MLPHFQARSTIMDIFKSFNPLKDYHVKFYELDSCYLGGCKEKVQVDENDREYILFKIDIYFSDYNLVVDIDGKEDEDEDKDLIFELRRKIALELNLSCKFIRINPLKDLNHEISYIQKLINEFKDNERSELKYKIKKLSCKNFINKNKSN